jgi:hypothetical protein
MITTIFSCNQKEEVVNFEDITTSSEKYKEGKGFEKKNQKDSIILSSFLHSFLDSISFPISTVFKIDKTGFIDRFENIESDKIQLNFTKDTIQLSYWKFKDSVNVKSTFYNWLDENQVSLFEQKKIKKSPFSLLVTSNKIVELNYQKSIDLEKWLPFLIEPEDSLFFLIQQKGKKPCVWLNNDLEEVEK